MVAQRYWKEHETEFVASMSNASSATEILEIYQRFLGGLKTHVLASYRQNAVLQQMIALLFAEEERASEILLTREEPAVIVQETPSAKKQPIWEKMLLHPAVIYALLMMGMVMSLLSGKNAWPCAIFFAAAAGLVAFRQNAVQSTHAQYQPKAAFSPALMTAHITRQMQQLDAHIDDLQALMKALTLPDSALPLDRDTLTLCQLIWANAHQGYPADTMLFAAEQLLHQNGLAWVEFSEETRACYQIMPTRNASRVVYPALRQIEDGSLVCKGQYLAQERYASREEAR